MEKSSQSPATTQETQALATPGLLDGVVIDSCVFTESVGKREPRPPLYLAVGTVSKQITGDVFLAADGGKVLVKHVSGVISVDFEAGAKLGGWYPKPPKGPAYTGPITPAMWAIIRKFWNP